VPDRPVRYSLLRLGVGLDILADGIDELYLRADDTMRRLMNQAIFQAIWVCDEDVIGSQLTPEFATITSIATGIEQTAVAYAATLPEPEGARAGPSAVLGAWVCNPLGGVASGRFKRMRA